MNQNIRLLHLENDPLDAKLIRRRLEADGLAFTIVWVQERETFEAALRHQEFDLVLSDYELPGYDGNSALRYLQEHYPRLPLIFVSGRLDAEDAVHYRNAGAAGCVPKQALRALGAAVLDALGESP